MLQHFCIPWQSKSLSQIEAQCPTVSGGKIGQNPGFSRLLSGFWHVCPHPVLQHFFEPSQSLSVLHSVIHTPAEPGLGQNPGSVIK